MSTISKSTPVAFFQKSLNPQWGEINNMPVATGFESSQIEETRKQVLGVTDVSCLQRFGVKGPQASKWLSSQGISVPDAANTWVDHEQSIVLRLGGSEFLIEDQSTDSVCQQLDEAVKVHAAGVYKVLRADAAFVISGDKVLTMFSELCRLDLSERELGSNQLIMTQVADISATVLAQTINGQSVFRLWCDGTFGAYMWRVLHQLAQELGGGAVGFSSIFNNK